MLENNCVQKKTVKDVEKRARRIPSYLYSQPASNAWYIMRFLLSYSSSFPIVHCFRTHCRGSSQDIPHIGVAIVDILVLVPGGYCLSP